MIQPIFFHSIQGWEDFWDDGNKYLKTAVGAHQKRKKGFTPEILYNIIAMAIEKFVMAALMRYGTMPNNHRMIDFVEAMEKTFSDSIGVEIREGLLMLDTYQDICDIDTFNTTSPDKEKIPLMLNLAERLRHFLQENVVGYDVSATRKVLVGR